MFSRENTKELKGIAIILMLAHHLFAFPDKIPFGYEFNTIISINGISIPTCIGIFGQICVSVFMFLGGYGIYKQIGQKNLFLNKIVNLYKSYWKIFFIFVPVGFIFFRHQPVYCENSSICNVFDKFSLNEFIGCLVGYYTTYNKEWWFLLAYLCTVFLGVCFIVSRAGKGDFYRDLLFIIVLMIFTQSVFPAVVDLKIFPRLETDIYFRNFFTIREECLSFFTGIVFAKYDAVNKALEYIHSKSAVSGIVCSIIGIGILIYLKTSLTGEYLDLFYTPLFVVFCLVLLTFLPCCFRKVLKSLGNNSMNMWFIHSFYCYYFYNVAKIVYYSRNPWLALLVLIVITFASSVCVNHIYGLLNKFGCYCMTKVRVKGC